MPILPANHLMGYMSHLPNFVEHFDFTDDAGQPDPKAASVFAERLRTSIATELRDGMIKVHQHGARVTMRVPTRAETNPGCAAVGHGSSDY